MSEIIYPTLDLFLYDLRDGLGESQKEIAENREQFKQKLPASVHASLFEFDKDFEAEYVELLGRRRFEPLEDSSQRYEGYYYPVRLGDSYGLLLDCSVENQTKPLPASSFADLKTEVLQRLNGKSASLGQTWIISGQMPNSDNQSPESIAQTCYEVLMPDGNWQKDFRGQGHLLGGTIFELWRYRLVMKEVPTTPSLINLPLPTIQSIQDNHHVIIILYSDEATAKKAASLNFDWMCLFYYRSKIMWAYAQSRWLKHSLKEYFITIQKCIKDFRQHNYSRLDLKKLGKTLQKVQDTLYPYGIDLTYLDYQCRTIDINLSNYKKRLTRIEERIEAEAISSQYPNDLKFLEKFSADITDKYLLQVQKDYENLELGLKLLDSSINTVRSRVEVSEAERERIFQKAVAIVGVGLSAVSIVVSLPELRSLPNDPVRSFISNPLHVPKPWLEPATLLVYGVGTAIIFGTLTGLGIWLWGRLVRLWQL